MNDKKPSIWNLIVSQVVSLCGMFSFVVTALGFMKDYLEVDTKALLTNGFVFVASLIIGLQDWVARFVSGNQTLLLYFIMLSATGSFTVYFWLRAEKIKRLRRQKAIWQALQKMNEAFKDPERMKALREAQAEINASQSDPKA